MIFETDHLSQEQKQAILALWNAEYPQKLHYANIEAFEAYLHNLSDPHHYLLINSETGINGWAFTFIRDSEKWFAIILDGHVQRKGIGTLLLNKMKETAQELNGWVTDHNNDVKQNGEQYLSPLGFYLKNRFTLCADVRLETEKLSAVKITWKAEKGSHK